MSMYLLSADVARLLGVTPAAVREAAISGRLSIAATTRGGVRLFDKVAVERFRREREAKRSGLIPSGETA
jgi:hypothetical protein